ncbi:MurR/RpiR family transcriptional regulator [Actibacterium sp. D379-3]
METVQEQIKDLFDTLTRAERQLANTILENYPMSGMGSITRLAETSGVSTPTVARMVQKLGFSGFPAFQAALRAELEARISNPIEKHDHWSDSAPQEHILNRFADAVLHNIRQTLANVDPVQFDRAAALIADTGRRVFVHGGRITHTVCDYLQLHLQVIRPGVILVPPVSSAASHALLDMQDGDVLVIYDVRRYENMSLLLARMAQERGVEIILFTDQWQSPVEKHAILTFSCRIEAPSAWDSLTAVLLLTETIIAAVQEISWSDTARRMKELEEIFDQTRIFRKFI